MAEIEGLNIPATTAAAELPAVEFWAMVDVMGHNRFIGRVTEQVIAGCGFVRVDVPPSNGTPGFTKLIGTSSIYAISPVEESVAKQMASANRQTPIEAYCLPSPEKPASDAAPRLSRGWGDSDDSVEDW